MKTIFKLLILSAVFLSASKTVSAQNLFTEDFNYPVRDSLEGLGGWFLAGGNSPYNIKIVSPGLTYASYPGSGVGNTAHVSNQFQGDICLHNFTTQTSGTLYMAFMVRVDSLTARATRGYNIGFDQSGNPTNFNTSLYIKKVSSNIFNFGLSKSDTATYSSITYNTNTTYLVVLKYTFVAGSSVKYDGIRIGTTWSSAVLTGINIISAETPSGYRLEQNYPNPFNPMTNVKFQMPNAGFVKLIVYDIMGKEIATLVNEELSAGIYKASFDGTNLPSGVYFCRLEAEGFTDVKKMTLVK